MDAVETKVLKKLLKKLKHHDDTAISEPQISTEALVDIINSIPPPIELSMLIKEVGGDYTSGPLNSPENSGKI